MLDEGGAIPSIVRLLGSRCPRVMSAAVSTVRNLSDQGTFPVYTALFKAGASSMLVHVVASNAGAWWLLVIAVAPSQASCRAHPSSSSAHAQRQAPVLSMYQSRPQVC
jgi:hypothetical protein